MDRTGVAAMAVATVIFSTFEVVSKMVTTAVDPLQINFLRFALAGIVFLPPCLWVLRRSGLPLSVRDWKEMFIVGLLNVTICLTIFQLSIKYIPASAAAVIFSVNPIFAHLWEKVFYRTKFSRSQATGLVVSLTGLVLVLGSEIFREPGVWYGVGLTVLAAAVYGLFMVYSRPVTERLGSLVVNGFSSILGAAALLPLLLVLKVPVITFDMRFLPHMLYLALIGTCLANYCFLLAVERLGAGQASMFFFGKPVLATLFAVWLLHEGVSLPFAIGTAAIIAGLVIYSRSRHPKTEQV